MGLEAANQEKVTSQQGATSALVLATLAFALCFAVWGMIAPLAPLFRDLYRLSGTEVGLLVAVPVLLGSVARIPMGMLTDRYGGRLVFTALLLVVTVPTALAGFASSYLTLLTVSFFLGLAGSSFAVGVPFVARWYHPSRQGFALGIYGMGNIGTAIANLVAPRMASAYGWPSAFWVFLPPLVALAVAYWLVGRNAPSFAPQTVGLRERLSVFRRGPLAWFLALFYFVTFGGFVANSLYLPTLLVGQHQLEPTDAALRAGGFVVLATLARPLGGFLSDRWGAARILSVVFLIVAVLAIVLALVTAMPVITVAFLGIAMALGMGNGAVFKLVPELFLRETGTVTGLVGAAGGLGGFFPPIVMGLVLDVTGSYAIGFTLFSAFALACLLVNARALGRHMPPRSPRPV